MTDTAIATPKFYVAVGQTDAEFEVQYEREWGVDGLPFTYEYLALPWDAQVKELRRSEGVADSYAAAASLARLVASTAPAKAVIMFTVSDGTGQTFCATGWEPREDALATLERLAG